MKKLNTLTLVVLTSTILNFTSYIADAQSISAGFYHSLFLCGNNSPMACGWNGGGQLGDGTITNRYNPVPVNFFTNFTAMDAGYQHSLFLKNDSTVWACGMNLNGELGDGTTAPKRITPVQVSSLSGIIAVSGGNAHSLFLKKDGTVWACGHNTYGELGDGTMTKRITPVQVSSLSGIIAISAGSNYSLFLKNDSTVWACGENQYGNLGDGTIANRITPVHISSLNGIAAIAAGEAHSLFLKNNGSVWACGKNASGQLGNGSTINKQTPTQVNSLTGITTIAAGVYHSLFLKNNGNVWICGKNSHGQLGDGTTSNKLSPVQLNSLSNIIAVSGGYTHSLFLKNNGSVWSSGENFYGELGDETYIDKHTPVLMHLATARINGSNAFCQGNNLTLSANSGSSYLWSTNETTQSIVVSTPGSYTVVVTNSCGTATTSSIKTVTVSPLPIATITSSGATTICQGNSVILSATNGMSSYLWSNNATTQSITVSNSENDSVTVTNGNGCSTTSSPINVMINPSPTATITPSGTTSFCQGDSVILTATIGMNSYLWSNSATTQSITVLSSEYDSVKVTGGNGCSAISSVINVIVYSLPLVTFNLDPDTVCITASAYALTGGSPSGGIYSENGINVGNFNPTIAGNGLHTITYFYSDGNSCSNIDTAKIFVSICTGIETIFDNSSINIFPNPSNGMFTIATKENNCKFIISNVFGENIYQTQITSWKSEIDIRQQPKGIYFIRFIKPDKTLVTVKSVIVD